MSRAADYKNISKKCQGKVSHQNKIVDHAGKNKSLHNFSYTFIDYVEIEVVNNIILHDQRISITGCLCDYVSSFNVGLLGNKRSK